MTISELLGLDATTLVATVGAIGAFGTAASGLVDATKAFRGGISNVGLRQLTAALEPFQPALDAAVGSDWRDIVRAHWHNGKAKDDQKAIATSLIQLGLRPDTAQLLASHGHVDGVALQAAVDSLVTGRELTPEQVNVLGRFKTAVEAKMDAAFERADQVYRNVARVASGGVALLLSLAGGWIVHVEHGGNSSSYPFSQACATAFLIGLIAVPIAPITKDLLSSLSAAVHAIKLARGQ